MVGGLALVLKTFDGIVHPAFFGAFAVVNARDARRKVITLDREAAAARAAAPAKIS